LIIHQAEIESNTQTTDHNIQFFAFLIFSSSQPDIRYIIQLSIKAITAITAIYFIKVVISHQPISAATFSGSTSSQGNHNSNSFGASANTLLIKFIINQKLISRYFFIILI